MSQVRNQQLTCCRGKLVISGQNVPGQESKTYILSKRRRKQTRDQWTERPRTEINNLLAVKAPEKANSRSVDRMSQDRNQRLTTCRSTGESKLAISGQNVPGQESTTYSLSRRRRVSILFPTIKGQYLLQSVETTSPCFPGLQ
jgi:hypothetical protein